jgi:hypothetical protein
MPKDEARIAYKCAVASLEQAVEDVTISLRIEFFDRQEFTTDIQFPLLSRDRPLVFYIINQCPSGASIIIPDTASLKLLQEQKLREVPLRGADPGSIGKLDVIFFPSGVKWTDKPDCS